MAQVFQYEQVKNGAVTNRQLCDEQENLFRAQVIHRCFVLCYFRKLVSCQLQKAVGAPQLHQAFINHDPLHPGYCGSFVNISELRQRLKELHEPAHHHFFSFFIRFYIASAQEEHGIGEAVVKAFLCLPVLSLTFLKQ